MILNSRTSHKVKLTRESIIFKKYVGMKKNIYIYMEHQLSSLQEKVLIFVQKIFL